MARRPLWMIPLAEPECPPGWRTGPPDFVGVGVQRAGTTWWYRAAIRKHPNVVKVGEPGKELHYFDRFWNGEPPSDFAERYHRLFPRPEGKITGEWTPGYMNFFWIPPLLRRAAPEARILIMLRDPIERYRSATAKLVRAAEADQVELDLSSVTDAAYRGLYHRQLAALFEHFPRERVLVLQYERCLADPVGEMATTQRFLGLEPLAEPPRRLLKENPGSGPKPQLPDWLRAELVGRLAEDMRRLARLLPEIDLSLWPNFSHLR